MTYPHDARRRVQCKSTQYGLRDKRRGSAQPPLKENAANHMHYFCVERDTEAQPWR